MTKTIKILALFIGLTMASFTNAQCGGNGNGNGNGGNSDAHLITKAINAAHAQGCLSNSSHNVYGNVETTSICFVSGFLKKVTLYATPYCPPGFFCAQYLRLVATVEFGCDGNVVSVTCEP